jgi:protein gp37
MQHGRRMRVFCASMSDVFEDNPDVESERVRLWSLIAETPMLDWLLLTKRPENMLAFTPWHDTWPNNVWAMTSVENQEYALERVPALAKVPAVVRGLSVEPLLGAVDLRPWLSEIQWVIVGGESGRDARSINPLWVRDIRDQCAAANVAFFFKQWGEWSPVTSDMTAYEQLLLTNNNYQAHMYRAGKKASGRLLDGQTWNALPDVELTEISMHTEAAS